MNCQEKLESLSPLLEQSINGQYFSGAVVGVFQEGTCCARAWGTTAMQGEQLLTSHLFDLASLSKLFTTAAILRLIDSGAISDQTRLLDVFPLHDPDITAHLKKVSVANLLTHASGLQAWYPFYTRRSDSFEVILRDLLVSSPLQQGVVYSDINFMLLGMLVSNVTGLPLEEAITTLVFNPLKMTNATYHPQPAQCVATEFGNQIEKRMVAELGLQFTDWRSENIPLRGQCNDGNSFYYFGGVAGHAGIFADVSDVLALGRAFMPNCTSLFSHEVLERALHDWGGGRGYGVQFGDLYPDNGFGHTGFTGTYLYVNPLRDLVVVVLTNRLHTSNVRSINHIRIEAVKRLLVR